MLRATLLTLFALTAAPALAESPPEPECNCTADETCWDANQFCVSNDIICTHSADCALGSICDLSNGDAGVPGICRARPTECTADADCEFSQLCAVTGRFDPTCAEDDDLCNAPATPTCDVVQLCDGPGDLACFGDTICVQERCTVPALVDAIAAIDADLDRVADQRDRRQNAGDDDQSCATVPGGHNGSGVALLGLLGLLGLRRR